MRDWRTNKDKFNAIADVLRHILSRNDSDYQTLCQQCLQSSQAVRQLFINQGQITPPAGAKVVFVPAGDDQRPDGGSLRLEPPPDNAGSMTDQQLLKACLLSPTLGPPSTSTARQWDRPDDRAAAVVDVLRHLTDDQAECDLCLQDDAHSFRLFITVGKIQPPPEIKTIFMPTGQVAAGAGGSLVLQIPTQRVADVTLVQANTVCCYRYWNP